MNYPFKLQNMQNIINFLDLVKRELDMFSKDSLRASHIACLFYAGYAASQCYAFCVCEELPYGLLLSRSVTGKLKCVTFNLPKYANVF